MEYMLTTVDNPYNPFTDYDLWYAFDERQGYHSAGLLARVAMLSDDLSEADEQVAIDQAIDEIVSENVLGVFTKVANPNSEGT